MRPLESLPEIERLLRHAPPEPVRAELVRLAGESLAGVPAAARRYAEGAWALREGRLPDALAAFEEAAAAFSAAHEAEAEGLAHTEAWLVRIRRGPRAVYAEADAALEAIARASQSRIVRVVATHYRGVAQRYAGHAEQTLALLLDAFVASDGLLAERAQVLNSLGTLYVVLGAYGAAQAVLDHAAELNHQLGDRVSEAISYGQLGSAALARGELEAARRYLQKQEWLASRVGDRFGQARALVLLGDLAIDLGRPDDAVELAEQARAVATAVDPPLGMWVAYATRTIGRARLELGDGRAGVELEQARAAFRRIGNQLGEALVTWDVARLAARAPDGGERAAQGYADAAFRLATLGLTARIAQLLSEKRAASEGERGAGAPDPEERAHKRALELAIAACAQPYPHLAAAQEVELVYADPATLAELATRRIEGQRNLGRLAALTLSEGGLFVAALAAASVGRRCRALPSERSSGALCARLPGVALWCWAPATSGVELARDLSSLRAAAGDDARAALAFCAGERLRALPFAGDPGAELASDASEALVARALGLPAGVLERAGDVPWDNEAEALAVLGGYAVSVRM